ncbi:MAG: efflux RND transporter permease subunit [Arenicella sp.]
MIRWFAHNPVAANLLMFAILAGGLVTLLTNRIPLEVFPEFEFERVNVVTSIRGATPSSVEEGVTIRIEEAIQDLEGIKKLSSRSAEGLSTIYAEVAKGYDSRKLLNDIKLRVDAISTLPTNAERPVISIPARVRSVISVVITGDLSEKELRQLAENHRDQMLDIKGVSEIELDSARDYEISIHINPTVLDSLNITLQDVSNAINSSSLDLSAGNIKSAQGEILVRTNAQSYTGDEYARIPVITTNAGNTILLGDIADINDGFEEDKTTKVFNNRPASILYVYRTGDQSAIQVADKVKQYLEEQTANLPDGVSMSYWRDRSKTVKGRLNTLLKSAWQGGILVILLLTLFLRPSVAAWVCLGIPISFMGALLLMPQLGVTLNVVSMFAFILALGIVVDDAIVTGENVYRHMRMGKDSLTAAIEGTEEVATPVTFGVLTTVVAFVPLLMIEGTRGAIFAQIPAIVIPVLLFSLVESKLVLPAHLRHVKPLSEKPNGWFSRVQRTISEGFEKTILRFYQPLLEKCIHNKTITLLATLVITVVIFATVMTGSIRFTFFPRIDSEVISASLTMPTQTAFETTDRHIQTMTRAAQALQEKYRDPETGDSLIVSILSTSGGRYSSKSSNLGNVVFEILPPDERVIEVSSRDIVKEWRQTIGGIPGAEQLSFRAEFGRAGEPIEIQLSGNNLDDLRIVGDQLKEQLKTYDGLFDIQDNLSGGKDEFQLKLKPEAYNLGINLQQIGSQVRQAFFGLQTQRIQRGRDEVRVMLRLPPEHRSSLKDLYSLPIQLGNGSSVELAEVANIETGNSPSSLYRINRFRTLSVTADAEKERVDLEAVKRDLITALESTLASYPDISYEMEGEAKEQQESYGSLYTGLILIMLAIYALLAIPFKSYNQPLIVMSIIPIGFAGAIAGHFVYNWLPFEKTVNLSIMSMMGMLALVGVVINDSLVLVDYINKQRQRGSELASAVLTAGAQRFRPVMLTSLTTFAGLSPLLLEQSTQAQFLKPMAISLGFGILFATFITLLVIPVIYFVGAKMAEHRPTGIWWVSVFCLFILMFHSTTTLSLNAGNPFNLSLLMLWLFPVVLLIVGVVLLFMKKSAAIFLFMAIFIQQFISVIFYTKNHSIEGSPFLIMAASTAFFALIIYYIHYLKQHGYFSAINVGSQTTDPAHS